MGKWLAVSVGLVTVAFAANWAAKAWPSAPWRLMYLVVLAVVAYLIISRTRTRVTTSALLAGFAAGLGVALAFAVLMLGFRIAVNAVPADATLGVSAFVAWNQGVLLDGLAAIFTVLLASLVAALPARNMSTASSRHA